MIDLNPKAIRVSGEGGVGINVWDHGGSGPDLLLAHCTGTHGRIWDPLVPGLRERYRVIAVDTRGHGDSDKPQVAEAYRWSLAGHDLLKVVDALCLKPGLSAVGHSAGAAHIVYAEWFRPGTFSRVVLFDPIIGPAAAFRGENPLAERARRRKNVLASFEAARERLGSKPPMNAWDPAVLEAYVRYGFRTLPDGSVELKCSGHMEAMVYDGSGATDVFEHLGELGLEVLLVTSDGSDIRHLAALQKDRFSRVTFREISGASHFLPLERPHEVQQLILEWIGLE